MFYGVYMGKAGLLSDHSKADVKSKLIGIVGGLLVLSYQSHETVNSDVILEIGRYMNVQDIVHMMITSTNIYVEHWIYLVDLVKSISGLLQKISIA